MRSTLLFIIFFYSVSLFGQQQKASYFSLQEGLSSHQALDITHDNEGFIWIATEFGLNRFASNSFRQYYKSEKADGLSVNSNEINTLLYDNDQLYIGTRSNGLNVLDIKTHRFSYYLHDPANSSSIATNDITDIIKAKNDKIWLATFHRGVQRFDPVTKKFERFNKQNIPSLPENGVWALTQDKAGLLYIGHVSKGVSILDVRTRRVEVLSVKTTQGILPDNEVKSLFCDTRNNIWIGTRKGLAVYNPNTKKIQRISLAALARNGTEPFVYSLKEVDGQMWIGAEASQLFTFEPVYGKDLELVKIQKSSTFNLNKSNNSSVQNIDRDEYGNIWFAIYNGGAGFIGHFAPFFSIIPTEPIVPGSNNPAAVTGILKDQDNSTWLATAGNGILQIQADGKTKEITKHNSGLADNFLLSGFEDSQHNKWFGLERGGVSFFDSKTKTWRVINPSERMTSVRAIIENSQGNICFAAEEGLFIYNPKLKTFKKVIINTPMLGDYAPRTLVEDSRGLMWVGTYGQGLYVYDQQWKLIRKISKGQGIGSNTINHVLRDRRNNVWIATNEGLAIQSVNKKLGDLDNVNLPKSDAWHTINAVAEDRNGNIWCSTRLGLLRYLPDEKRFLSYDHAFGLPLGGFTKNSVATDKKGGLFFGMPEGVCYFDPSTIPLSLPKSPISISRFTVFNTIEGQSQSEKYPGLAQEINLKHMENSFRIELAVMDYALNDIVEFSYKLNGLDDNWNLLGDEKNLDFRNIPYGRYELWIRTRLKNEKWSDEYMKFFINIAPPIYLSTIAIVFYCIIIASTIFAVLFFYFKKINAEAQLHLKKLQLEQDGKLHMERMNFYTNITHELRTPLTMILGPLEDLLAEQHLSSKHKDWVLLVQKSANRLFSLVNQLLEFRKVESQFRPLVLGEGFLSELIHDIVLKYVESNSKKELTITFINEQEDIKTVFDAEIVQLILDNLLSNACKYTTSGSVSVKLTYEQDAMSTCALISVKDTGLGIPTEHLNKIFDKFYQVPRSSVQGTGIGLALVKELAAIHHGKISVTSELGTGSEFCVSLLTNVVRPSKDLNRNNGDAERNNLAHEQDQRPLLLLVEDDTDLREYLASSLSSKYEVIQADNGNEGLSLAKSRIPDIILSDIMMPNMNGFEMLEILKKDRETSHISMIFLTAMDTEIDKERGYQLGVDSYLTKPVNSKLLHLRIENLLAKRKHIFAEVWEQLSEELKQHTDPEVKVSTEMWRENSFVMEFVNVVENCIQNEVLDAATLADKMNMSQSTLYRKLKGLTGKNINQLVRKVRIQKAAQLLRSGQHNITEVSLLVGINSSIYFRQCFKEEFGVLPSEYQKNIAVEAKKPHFDEKTNVN
jgi:signal transduction histidine kinase/ligand-binding sensor domain-containing protein/DNA-binding response OmpR family regulator